MGGAQPPRTSVISPATGPVWAAHQTAPFLPTAALPRPWWPLQTRQATAWKAQALAREVGVQREAPRFRAGISTGGRWFALILLPVSLVWEFLLVHAAPGSCMAPVDHGWTAALSSLLSRSSDFALWLLDLCKTVSSSGDFIQTTSALAERFLYSAFDQLCLCCRRHQLRRSCLH